MQTIKPNMVDRVVGYFSAEQGLNRLRNRASYAQAMSAFKSADKSSNKNRNRNNVGGDGDRHIDSRTLFELRETSRDLDRDNGLNQAINNRIIENVIGPKGFRLKPKTGNKSLNKRVSDDFLLWQSQADIRGEFEYWPLMRRVYRSQLVDGDHFIETINDGLKLSTFEGDRVLTPLGEGVARIGKYKIVNGITKDNIGRSRHLFVANKSPLHGIVSPNEGKVIKANRIIQFYNPKRLTQTRGLPAATPVIRDMDDIDDLLLYNRIGAKLVAAMGYFIKTEDPAAMSNFMQDELQKRNNNERIQTVEPMSIHYLKPHEDIVSVESNRPGNGFDNFIQLMNRYVGLPYGLPFELVMLDFSKVNFASSRQLLNQAQLGFKVRQNEFGSFNSRIYRWWLWNRIRKGAYEFSPTIYKHEWGMPGWPSPNPLQDAQASDIRINNGTLSRTYVTEQGGIDLQSIRDDLINEKETMIDKNLILSVIDLMKGLIEPEKDLDEKNNKNEEEE